MKNKNAKNVVVYPYNFDFTPVLRYAFESYENVQLLAPRSWALAGKDASYADGGTPIGVKVGFSLEEAHQADILIVPEYESDKSVDMIARQLIEAYLGQGKEVYCYMPILLQNNLDYTNNPKLHIPKFPEVSIDKTSLPEELKRIDVPVAIVCGLLDNVNKFDVLLGINKGFVDNGYRVACISNKSYAPDLSFFAYPKQMTSQECTLYEKVFILNSFVKNIEVSSSPDLILIEIPGGIMPYSEGIYNGFGEFANIVFNAVFPDYTCLCIPCTAITPQYLDMLKLVLYYRFNVSVDSFYFSNRGINIDKINRGSEFEPMILGIEGVVHNLRKIAEDDNCYAVFNFTKDGGNSCLYEHVKSVLLGEYNG